jgi:serine/threonine protein kinase
MLRAIEGCHSRGILHRDIKPSNFLVRASARFPLVLIDFGLSRPFINPANGSLLNPRSNPGFVGTLKYASVNAHEGKELGRRDDLASWFFIVVEMARGILPWGKSEVTDHMFSIKQSISLSTFLRGLPPGLKEVWRLIRKLGRAEEPDYELLTQFLCQAMAEVDAKWDDPYDWENLDLSAVSPIPLTPTGGESEIPMDLPQPGMATKPRRSRSRRSS